MIDDIKSFNNATMFGNKILNINHSIKLETDFTKYVESMLNNKKSKVFLWVRSEPSTLKIFERLVPLLNRFNRYDKEQFLLKGSLLVTNTQIFCGYPFKRDQKEIFQHPPLDIVYE